MPRVLVIALGRTKTPNEMIVKRNSWIKQFNKYLGLDDTDIGIRKDRIREIGDGIDFNDINQIFDTDAEETKVRIVNEIRERKYLNQLENKREEDKKKKKEEEEKKLNASKRELENKKEQKQKIEEKKEDSFDTKLDQFQQQLQGSQNKNQQDVSIKFSGKGRQLYSDQV
ncbi:MAG: hypothetical protein EZS28_032480 [Streblomastix strix]|uniref:Uncharacterized protein n=1 Tax=Streblomastix strix TaxID=222440 RepID=A0A5J4UNS3_9EUKA|nr:MAG: hypothetical protein EZS28_032480 [Streblomastix strix]